MTKTVSSGLSTHLALHTTTLAWCWQLTRTDSVAYYYTAHDAPLVIDGNTYSPASGFDSSALESTQGLAANKSELTAILHASGLSAEEVRAGLFDFAEVRVFLVNWSSLAQGKLRMRRGWLGEVTLTAEGVFKAELRGMGQAYSQRIVELSSPECRVDLFSTRCGLTAATYQRACTVTAITDRRVFEFSYDTGAAAENGYFDGGLVRWVTGSNAGRAIEIVTQTESTLSLFLPLAYDVEVGDTFTMTPGCDKSRATCRDKYENILNFQGEPDIPGNDAFFNYPDAPEQ